LFSTQPKLDDAPLAAMKPVEFAARDGMKINGYLTLPLGAPPRNLPLVLVVHGGPWARDSWGFNPYIQLLANRGYGVLQINFRGSTGFGKKYLHAGDRQWGLEMQTDLSDGVKWAVDQGIADPKRVAIFGGSYGGYAALAGAAFTPDLYRCAVDECGPSNLFTLLESFPPYWEVARSIFFTRVGNPGAPGDKALLTTASPLFSAGKIKIPMLIGQGANDPRVKQAEAEQIADAIAKHRASAVYVLYTDEGHGFVRPENRLDFTARMEKFLADNLGGRYEPMKGDRIPGSTAKLRVVGASPLKHQN
jgi:dipeptidyl aminopeptidase/acylaminoacyl peptidase